MRRFFPFHLKTEAQQASETLYSFKNSDISQGPKERVLIYKVLNLKFVFPVTYDVTGNTEHMCIWAIDLCLV
jgi:hypothetical protein